MEMVDETVLYNLYSLYTNNPIVIGVYNNPITIQDPIWKIEQYQSKFLIDWYSYMILLYVLKSFEY